MNVVSHACQGDQNLHLLKLRIRTFDESCLQVSNRAVQYIIAIVHHQGVQSMSSNGAGLLDFIKGIATPCRDIMMGERHVHPRRPGRHRRQIRAVRTHSVVKAEINKFQ